MFLCFLQACRHQTLKIGKFVTLKAVHEIDVVLCQFEGSLFKGPLARRILEHKPEINVQNVPETCQHDVAVVPVFHIEDVAKH